MSSAEGPEQDDDALITTPAGNAASNAADEKKLHAQQQRKTEFDAHVAETAELTKQHYEAPVLLSKEQQSILETKKVCLRVCSACTIACGASASVRAAVSAPKTHLGPSCCASALLLFPTPPHPIIQMNLRLANERYFRKHGEVKAMIKLFIETCLAAKPKDPVAFAAEFFCDHMLQKKLEAFANRRDL